MLFVASYGSQGSDNGGNACVATYNNDDDDEGPRLTADLIAEVKKGIQEVPKLTQVFSDGSTRLGVDDLVVAAIKARGEIDVAQKRRYWLVYQLSCSLTLSSSEGAEQEPLRKEADELLQEEQQQSCGNGGSRPYVLDEDKVKELTSLVQEMRALRQATSADYARRVTSQDATEEQMMEGIQRTRKYHELKDKWQRARRDICMALVMDIKKGSPQDPFRQRVEEALMAKP